LQLQVSPAALSPGTALQSMARPESLLNADVHVPTPPAHWEPPQ